MSAARTDRPRSTTKVTGVGFLASDVLLLIGTGGVKATPERVDLVTTSSTTLLDHDIVSLPHRDGAGEATWVLLATVPPGDVAEARSGTLIVGVGRATLTVGDADLGSTAVDIEPLAAALASALADADHPSVLDWLCRSTQREATIEPKRLGNSLFALREVLRERLAPCELLPGAQLALSVDLVLAADQSTYYLKGWARSVGAPMARLTAVSPEGDRIELEADVYRHRRDDVESFYAPYATADEDTRYGFISTIRLPERSARDEGWLVELVSADGVGVEAVGPAVQRDVAAARQLVLFDAVYEEPGEDMLRATHLAPALLRLQERSHEAIGAARSEQYGTPPPDPVVTIIVPLYQRLDFLEHQLAQFVHDSEIAQAELLYVLDSPNDEGWLRQLASTLFPLYRVPFRTVVMSHNGGFAAANNVGASVARGTKLLLLNSDVVPDRPGWLGRMVAFHDETPDIGALGVKLLYEDESLQHAGLYFKRVVHGATWNNEHLFKGLHRSFPGANVTRKVPAVTAACMMVDRQLYLDAGGLSTAFLQGDYEDSDFCLRLAQQGKETWYLSEVELYHLEGQSYPTELRLQTGQYNQWLHTHLWDDEITRIAAAWDGVRPSTASQVHAPPSSARAESSRSAKDLPAARR